MPVSFRLLPTLTFLLLLPGVPVWALTASDTTRPAQAQDPLPDMGIAPQVDDDARHFAEVAKKLGGDYTQPGSSVKNHTFFPTILYSLGGMVYFCTN